MESLKVVDADSHISEPPDLWEQYLEPEYRELAIRLEKDENGLEYLRINGKKPKGVLMQGGTLGRICSIGQSLERFLTPGLETYADNLVSGAVDPHERIKVLDRDGIDMVLLYPSLGLSWPAECEDAKVAAAYCRAYNNWLVDFCKPYPHRLFPIAQISLIDVKEGVKELKRTAKLGMKGVFLNANSINGRPYGHPYFDSFWAEAQDLDMPVGIHVAGNPNFPGSHLYRSGSSGESATPWWFTNMMAPGDVMIAFTTLFEEGVIERFPRLKVVILETGCGWIAWWLERMDHMYNQFHFTTKMKRHPSEYFQRQCWISMDPDEDIAPAVIELVGADKFIWASDYPHSEGHLNPVSSLRETIKDLPENSQRKILGENAIKLYDLA